MRFRTPLMLAPALLAGCTVGPDYERPQIAVSDQWIEPVSAEPVDPQWWARFGDPELTALVERALANNLTLAEARARVAETRALREAAQGGRLPEGAFGASATENRMSENGQIPVSAIPGFPVEFPLYDVGFDASWEIDLWGGTSRAIESAAANEQAAQWGLRDAQVSLVAELARAYVDYRAAQERVDISAKEEDAHAKVARLTGLLYDAGEADKITADRAVTALGAARATLEQAQAELAGTEYRIAVLVGEMPEDILPQLRASTGDVPEAPAVIASGVRSELLERRPDIRRAERELASATARIGVAKSDLYPKISLLGGVGMQAQEPGDLFDGGSLRYSVGPSFKWPIFSLGTIRAQVRAEDARTEAATARYEAAIIGALADSESAANRFAAATAVARAAELSLERERNAYNLIVLREERGEDSTLEREQACLKLRQVERQDLEARSAKSAAAIALYKSLGGGWESGAQASR